MAKLVGDCPNCIGGNLYLDDEDGNPKCLQCGWSGSALLKRRQLCSFTQAILRRTCPYYEPGRAGYECRGFEQGITILGDTTIYHCKHDPPKQLKSREVNLGELVPGMGSMGRKV